MSPSPTNQGKRLVSIVGMNPLPALIVATNLEASSVDLVIAPAPPESELFKDSILRIDSLTEQLSLRGIPSKVHSFGPHDDPRGWFDEHKNELERLCRKAHLDVTGGTKVMTEQLVGRWQSANTKADVDIWYLESFGSHGVLRSYRQPNELELDTAECPGTLSVEDLSKLYGLPVVPGASRNDVEKCVYNHLKEQLSDSKIRVCRDKKNTDKTQVYGVGWDLDVIVTIGTFLIVIECKTMGHGPSVPNYLRKVDQLAKRFGGDNAVGILVFDKRTLSPAHKALAAQLGVEAFDKERPWKDSTDGLVAAIKRLAAG